MRRPPVIILCLLVLLSIGGAGIYQHFRKTEPTFAEVDSFLKHQAATGDWQYYSHTSRKPWQHPYAGWWDYLLIHRTNTFQQDEYAFGHNSGKVGAIVMMTRQDGTIIHLQIITAYPLRSPTPPATPAKETAPIPRMIEDLEKPIYGRFPEFAPPAPLSTASP